MFFAEKLFFTVSWMTLLFFDVLNVYFYALSRFITVTKCEL